METLNKLPVPKTKNRKKPRTLELPPRTRRVQDVGNPRRRARKKIIETTAQEWKDILGKMPDGYGIFSLQIIDSAQRQVVLWKKNDGKTSFIDAQLGVEIELEGEYGVEDAPVILARLDNAVPVGVLLTDVIQPFGKM